MTRPFILDTYCKAGGAGKGYYDAGFEVVGVDVEPQPRYPYAFVQADALEVLGDRKFLAQFDAIHASPPCQDHSSTRDFGGDHGTGWMLAASRAKLAASGLPWVLENVATAPLARQDDLFGANGLTLCGCMFPGLRGLLYEDRVFEVSFGIPQPRHVKHLWPQTKMGRPLVPGECMQVTGHFADAAEGRRRMGIPWMTRNELAQAIPPAYTRYVGARLLEHLAAEEAA